MSVNSVKKRKPRRLQEGCGRELFLKQFGKPIEEYACFKRAIEGLDKETVKSYKKLLVRFFMYLKEDPDTVIANRQKDVTGTDLLNIERYERHVKTYIKLLEAEGKVVTTPLNRIQGFFTNNSRRLSLDMGNLKISTDRKNKKYSPSQEDVRLLNSFADSARDHFIITVAFQNGVLPVDLAALQIGEYPTEPWIYYHKKRSKTGETWHGTSTPDACMYLKAYMVFRKGKKGEPLLLSREGHALDGEAVSGILSGLIEKAKLNKIQGFMPKCLRDGFEDALTDAEVYHKTKEALMGHGGIQHRYGSDNKIAERVIEAMRKVYPLICLTENKSENVRFQEFTNAELADIHELLRERALAKLQKDSL